MGAPWRIELLGWLRAIHGDRAIRRWRMQKMGALLAYLAYYSHRSHPREQLIELLWTGCDRKAGRNRLSVVLSSLRRQLEPPGVPAGTVILTDHTAVQLDPTAVTTDVGEFQAALQAAARAGSGDVRMQRLVEAVERYRGELLPGCYEAWVHTERQRLAEAYLQALAQLIRHLEEKGDFGRALDYARRAVAVEPLREEAHHDLMRLLVAKGQLAAALRQYAELERLLKRELGAAPEAAARDLARTLEQWKERTHRRPSAPRRGSSVTPGPLVSMSTVTFLLSELEETVRLRERRSDACPGELQTHQEMLLAAVGSRGGQVIRTSGRSLVAAFPSATAALAAAVAGMKAAQDGGAAGPDPEWRTISHRPPSVRMALHTGDVELPEGKEFSPVLHHALRLLLASHPGQILVSEATTSLLRDDLATDMHLVNLGCYRLRPDSSPATLFQVSYPGMASPGFPPPNAVPARP